MSNMSLMFNRKNTGSSSNPSPIPKLGDYNTDGINDTRTDVEDSSISLYSKNKSMREKNINPSIFSNQTGSSSSLIGANNNKL